MKREHAQVPLTEYSVWYEPSRIGNANLCGHYMSRKPRFTCNSNDENMTEAGALLSCRAIRLPAVGCAADLRSFLRQATGDARPAVLEARTSQLRCMYAI